MKAKKVDNTLGDVEAEALANTLFDRLAGAKAKKVKETLTDVMADLLVETLAARLAAVTAATHWAMWRPLHWSTRLLTR